MITQPLPGTEKAQDQGCTCPVIDNHYGDGRPVGDERHYVIAADCSLHGSNQE